MRYKQFGHDETLYSNLVEAIKGATVGQAVAHLGSLFVMVASQDKTEIDLDSVIRSRDNDPDKDIPYRLTLTFKDKDKETQDD